MKLTHHKTYSAPSNLLLGLKNFSTFGSDYLITYSQAEKIISLFSFSQHSLSLKKKWSHLPDAGPVIHFSDITYTHNDGYSVDFIFAEGQHSQIKWSASYPQWASWQNTHDPNFDIFQAWKLVPTTDWAIYKYNSTLRLIDTSNNRSLDTLNLNRPALNDLNIDMDHIFTGEIEGRKYAFGVSKDDNAIVSFFIGPNGGLHGRHKISNADGFYCEMPKIFDLVTMGEKNFLLVGDSMTDRVYVLKVNKWGGLFLQNDINDTLDTRFDMAIDVETVRYQDRVFVVAGGADDGVTLFELTADGRLHVVDVFADTLDVTLTNVVQIQAHTEGDKLVIFVSSEYEEGLTELHVDLSKLGKVIQGNDDPSNNKRDTLVGTNKDDVLMGFDGSDTLYGKSGDDRIIDGKGIDHMYGGSGADRFIFVDDERWDHVYDFEKGKDILDLTHIDFLYHISKLKIEQVSDNRWHIKYDEEGIDIRTTQSNITFDAEDFLFL